VAGPLIDDRLPHREFIDRPFSVRFSSRLLCKRQDSDVSAGR
jgi:hypothetical protein